MSEQQIYLPTGGVLPGIPGIQNAGVHLVDYDARTIRPAEDTPPPAGDSSAPSDTLSSEPAPAQP